MKRILGPTLAIAVIAGGFFAGRAAADQPHMQAALDHLRAARSELQAASTDKGGHRGRAIQLVNDAIREVEAGIAFDRTH